MSKIFKIFMLLLAFFLPLNANAQREQWFSPDDNLSSSFINKIYYDSRGMIWIVTEYGLNRFDGSSIHSYFNIPDDPTSIASNFINNIVEDADNRLFVCTHKGLQIYDHFTDRFTPVLHIEGNNKPCISMSDVVQLKSGEILALGDEVYRVEGKGIDVSLVSAGYPTQLDYSHRAIVDAAENVWIIHDSHGINRVAPDRTVTRYFGQSGDPVFNIIAIDEGTIYVGAENQGLYKYDASSDSFEKLEAVGETTIRTIMHDTSGGLLLGTDGCGIMHFNSSDNSCRKVQLPGCKSEDMKIHALATDQFGNFWVGVYQNGVLKIPRRSHFFKTMGKNSESFNLIGECCVTTICRADNNLLYVGTDNDGVYAVDIDNHTSRHFVKGLPMSILALFEDSRGALFLGSYDNGAGIIDKSTGAFTPINFSGKRTAGLHVYDFAEIPDGNILIATMGSGLYLYNPLTHKTDKLSIPGLSSEWITTVKVSSINGAVFAGTYDGLFVISSDLSSAAQVGERMIVNTIHEEPTHHNVWLGTSEGLVKLDKDLNIKKIYKEKDGLSSLSVYGIEHGEDALWLSSNRGLSKFDPYSETFTNYNVDNGLPNNEFYKNSSYCDRDGNIYFGGISGIAFFPAKKNSILLPKLNLRVTDFIVGGKSINAGDKSGMRVITDKPVFETETFKLAPNDNSFALRISAKEFVDGAHTDFYYSLDGNDWTLIPNSNNIYGACTMIFSGLDSGKHTLSIKANSGGMISDPLNVNIDIATVWYATWWAKIIYALLFVIIASLIYYYQRQRIKEKHMEVQRRHKAEILESKLQFFTNISHEIRTPLSLVISPLQKLIDSDRDEDRSTAYRTIMRNAKRILRLVNELMDLRKIDNRQMKMRFVCVDLCGFVNDIYGTFQPAASVKHITLTFSHSGIDRLDTWIDKSNFDKILMNLLSNAIKFTPENGKIDIVLSEGSDASRHDPLSHFAQIEIIDTGIGISEVDRKKIFNRFFQASNNTSGGTGIGLHLTSQLVELHHGEIRVDDNPAGVGTRFVVRVPLGCEHLSPDEIVDNVDEHRVVVGEKESNLAVDLLATPHSDGEKDKASRKKELVYVVEDDEEIRDYLLSSLGKYFRVSGFSNGRLAMEEIFRQPPSLVVTDLMMPEMDGIALTKKIKQNIHLNHIPVVVLTAKTRGEDNIEAMESGANAFITKPFNIDVLITTIHNQIENVLRMRNVIAGNQVQVDKIDKLEVSDNDEKLMARVMKVINKNLGNSEITVEEIASEVGISRVHLHRKLKEITNQSTRDFIRNIRLQAAAKLLEEKKLSVTEVSDLVGFKQSANFSTCFKEMYGMSPSAYAARFTQQKDK